MEWDGSGVNEKALYMTKWEEHIASIPKVMEQWRADHPRSSKLSNKNRALAAKMIKESSYMPLLDVARENKIDASWAQQLMSWYIDETTQA